VRAHVQVFALYLNCFLQPPQIIPVRFRWSLSMYWPFLAGNPRYFHILLLAPSCGINSASSDWLSSQRVLSSDITWLSPSAVLLVASTISKHLRKRMHHVCHSNTVLSYYHIRISKNTIAIVNTIDTIAQVYFVCMDANRGSTQRQGQHVGTQGQYARTN